ncbi:hypothetical protein B2G71_10420 [Novosphingobium sp. PC22D]|uniref:response regulator n=1 Tax=Novosphingobium sp. PC22D TaxID=1962403 RepID=UPI000BF020E3|nr:response regulator [Novosphingobium sp. PC22D]PEQ12709.1 hypothetical protein B2G71_10420 [Novosphingobium sp. PC22D]
MTDEVTDILVIDDDDITAELVERALRHEDGTYRIISATDGIDGLAQLRGTAPNSARRPLVVLLDLNMPRMSGFEFLRAVRADCSLRDSVIFVLTTSDAEEDRARAYCECAAGFMTKSEVGLGFRQVARLLSTYCNTVYLPA